MKKILLSIRHLPITVLAIYALALYVLLLSLYNLVWGIVVYTANPPLALPEDAVDPFYELGTSLGFWGTIFLGLNFVLATRWRWMERLFNGLDKVYQFHAWVGKVGLMMILLHLGILLLEAWPDQQRTNEYLLPGLNLSYTLGQVSIVLFTALVVITLWVKINYQTWLKTHQILGIPYILGGLHAIVAQGDWYMILLTALGGWAWIYSLLFFRRSGPNAPGEIIQVRALGDVTEIIFRLDSPLPAQPGQFIFFSVEQSAAGIPPESHPFSLSKIIDARTWRISVNKLGDYTRQLERLQPGDRVRVYGPFGTFGRLTPQSFPRQVWLAGGIGITPFLSLLQAETQRASGHPLHLIWAVRDPKDACYLDEIETLTKIVPHITFHLHTGKFSADALESLIGKSPVQEAAILMCGPAAMTSAVRSPLMARGKPEQHFFFEEFNFR
ncbi:MAG: ferric reductase-like transmembrane domain-containing protein [Anaerolineales bacterium]